MISFPASIAAPVTDLNAFPDGTITWSIWLHVSLWVYVRNEEGSAFDWLGNRWFNTDIAPSAASSYARDPGPSDPLVPVVYLPSLLRRGFWRLSAPIPLLPCFRPLGLWSSVKTEFVSVRRILYPCRWVLHRVDLSRSALGLCRLRMRSVIAPIVAFWASSRRSFSWLYGTGCPYAPIICTLFPWWAASSTCAHLPNSSVSAPRMVNSALFMIHTPDVDSSCSLGAVSNAIVALYFPDRSIACLRSADELFVRCDSPFAVMWIRHMTSTCWSSID